MTTVFAVTVLTGILLLGTLFKEIRDLLVDSNAPLGLVGKFLLTIIPYSMMFTLPWGFLSAILLVVGKLSSQNEIVSLRMAGQSLPRIALPIYILAIILSALSFWVNSEISPTARASQKQLLTEAFRKQPSAILSPGVIRKQLKEGQVYVEEREGDILKGFHLYQLPDELTSSAYTYLHADKAELVIDETAKQIRLALYDVYTESTNEEGAVNYVLAATAEPLVFDYNEKKKRRKKPKEMGSSAIYKDLEPTKATISELNQKLASNDNLDKVSAENLEQQLEKAESRLGKMHYELGRRSSFSLACLSFAIVGFPLALNSRRKETSAGLMLSIVIAGLYFAFLIFAKNSKEHGVILVWLPNILCLIIGLGLLWRARFR